MLRLPSLSLAVLRWIRLQLVPALLAVVLAFGLSGVSEAQAAAPVTMYGISGTNVGYFATKADACAAAGAYWAKNGAPGWPAPNGSRAYTSQYQAPDTCAYMQSTDGGASFAQVGSTGYIAGARCAPSGSAPDTSKPLAQQCADPIPAPTCPAAGQTSNANYYTVTSSTKLGYGLDFCIPMSGTSGGCGMTASGRAGGLNKTTGKWEYQYMGPLTTTGQVCTGNGAGTTDPKTDTEAPQKCDKATGMCTGTVNGVELCVKCAQTDTADTQTKSTTNPDGSTTQITTNTSTTVNNNNVTTTTTTTTTTTPAGGGTPTTKTQTDSTTESKDSFCQRNPNDKACKSSSSASGGDTCDTPPVCDGDAVQCAMLQQQYKMRCELQKSDEVADFGHALASGEDPDANKLPTPGSAPVVNLKDTYNGLDQMGVVAACMPDVRINIPGMVWLAPSTLTISTEPLCQHGKLLGYLNIIATCFVCAYMLKGSF